MSTKFLTIAGTASNVAKTLLSTFLCEIGPQMRLKHHSVQSTKHVRLDVTQPNNSEVSTTQWYQTKGQPLQTIMSIPFQLNFQIISLRFPYPEGICHAPTSYILDLVSLK
ncbi:MAG: hypothetical protein ACTS4U_00375 [Candidatus Hodgkinia cicadicola]